MAATYKKLANSPMCSNWNFAGKRDDMNFWRSRNGKLFAQRISTGEWFQIVSSKSK